MSAIGKASHTTKWLPVRDISVVWINAQRPLDKKWVAKIAEDFDPDMMGVLAVTSADENGQYHVIDGQHRLEAIRTMWGQDEKVPCNIFEASDPARAAEIFNTMNTSRKAVQPVDVFRVRVTAKMEPELSVNKIVTGLGYKVGTNMTDGYIGAVQACVAVYRKQGADILTDVFLISRACWGKTHEAVNGSLVRGLAEFLAQHGKAINRERLVKVVSRDYTPSRLLGAAKGAREIYRGSMSSNVARVLTNTYNHSLKTGRLGQ